MSRPVGPIERLHPYADRVRQWFFANTASSAWAWACLIVLLAGILVWFFVFSPYGAPAPPVYAEF